MSRTPFTINKNARRNVNGGAQDSEISVPKAPKAPKVPTVPPMMHGPTSPSPMARSRRGISQSYHVQATLNHGIRRDQQQHRRTTVDDDVGICKVDEEEIGARRLPMISPDTQRRPSVTIPLQHTKRHLEDGADDLDETRLKHRRIAGDLGRSLIHAQTRDNAANVDSGVYGAETQGIVDGPVTRSARDGQMELMMDENTAVSGSTSVPNVNDDKDALRRKSGLPDLAPLSPSMVMEGLEAEGDRLDDVRSDDEDAARIVPEYIKREMQKFEQGFNGLEGKFKLLNKIGEGAFSSVYKAIDLEYDKYDNSDWDNMDEQPSTKDSESNEPEESLQSTTSTEKRAGAVETGKVVAIKRIYVTSSPSRIENEIAILRDLSGHKNVVALITAHRYKDQVILVLPYFEHSEFRSYYRDLPMEGIRCYLRALLKGLAHVHSKKIIHRDVKPSNFLYDPVRKTGILVDFGLAERQEDHSESATQRTGSMRNSEISKNSLKRPTIASLKHGPVGLVHQTPKNSTGDLRAAQKPAQPSTPAAAQKSAQPSAPAAAQKSAEPSTPAAAQKSAQPSASAAAIRPNSSIQISGTKDIGTRIPQNSSQQASGAPNAAIPNQPLQMPNLAKHERSKTTGNPISTMINREPGYLRRDPRPVARVNRAGTRGFRAPEILFRHVRQTVALDIWSVGAILIAFLTGRFPFFHSYDEAEAVLEIAVLFGQDQMKRVAESFDRTFVTSIATINDRPVSLIKLCRALNPQRFGLPPTPGSRGTQSESRAQNEKEASMDDCPVEVVADEDVAIIPQARHEIEDQEDMIEDNDDPPRHASTPALEVGTEPAHKEEGGKDKSTQLKSNEAKKGLGENTRAGTSEGSASKKTPVVGWDSQEDLEEAVRLLECLLVLNPEERITAEEALRHPFLMEKRL